MPSRFQPWHHIATESNESDRIDDSFEVSLQMQSFNHEDGITTRFPDGHRNYIKNKEEIVDVIDSIKYIYWKSKLASSSIQYRMVNQWFCFTSFTVSRRRGCYFNLHNDNVRSRSVFIITFKKRNKPCTVPRVTACYYVLYLIGTALFNFSSELYNIWYICTEPFYF